MQLEHSSRYLATRQPGDRYRFWFDLGRPPHLLLEPVGPDGTSNFYQETAKLVPSRSCRTGAMLVDERNRLIFCSPTIRRRTLGELAELARRHVLRMPTLSALTDSSVCKIRFDERDDTSIRALNPTRGLLHRDGHLWTSILSPRPREVSDLLERAEPGHRFWCWLGTRGSSPLLLQPVSRDPNMERFNKQLLSLDRSDADATTTGHATLLADETLQLVLPELPPGILEALASWTRRHVENHPGLARLRHCRLARVRDGFVTEILHNPTLWHA